MERKRIVVLGATGSIGSQTLDIAREFPDRYEVVGLSANRDARGLEKAAASFPEARLALASACPADASESSQGTSTRPGAILDLVTETRADIVVNGIAGSAGLAPSIAALECGKDLALANKESVVMGYCLLETAAARSGASILPVDSEHAALFQLLRHIPEADRLLITASGGAFRDRDLADLGKVSPDEAAAHPSWKMGRKISIDSATMANKGLEVIEASRLFHVAPARIEVLIHPQSVVHALVRSPDGSFYANMAAPDMRLPILAALSHPEALASPFGHLDFSGLSLDFRKPEARRYPMLGLAYEALAKGYGATIAYNAADEVAVAAFEGRRIGYLDIAGLVERCLARDWPVDVADLSDVMEIDRVARETCLSLVKEHT
jgi:1-deoxy-D-xylulose-5-phosphate reductoisomerase